MARLISTPKRITGLYSFAADGGAISTIGLGVFIPTNAIITGFYVKVNTAPVGASGTIAFGRTGSTNEYMVATDVSGFVLNEIVAGRGFHDTPVRVSAFRELAITIATTALTAGVLVATVEFLELDI